MPDTKPKGTQSRTWIHVLYVSKNFKIDLNGKYENFAAIVTKLLDVGFLEILVNSKFLGAELRASGVILA